MEKGGKLSQIERIDLDKQISMLINDQEISENEIKALCEKVSLYN
jgi:hypothetical protein